VFAARSHRKPEARHVERALEIRQQQQRLHYVVLRSARVQNLAAMQTDENSRTDRVRVHRRWVTEFEPTPAHYPKQ